MIGTDTTLDELQKEKEKAWSNLVSSKIGSPAEKQFKEEYVSACRKIKRFQLA